MVEFVFRKEAMRIRFSLRALIIGVTLLCVVIALSIQFGPHLHWKTLNRDVSLGVEPISTRPLVDEQPDEPLVLCTVGPVSFEMPESMSNNFAVDRGFLTFTDGRRHLLLQLPKPDNGLLQKELADFPEKSKWTSRRLEGAIYEAKSSDFSWFMSHDELRWHKWLLSKREQFPSDVDSLESIRKPSLEANLVQSSWVSGFEWNTVDCHAGGIIWFTEVDPNVDSGRIPPNGPWVRHVCSTFKISGDPLVVDRVSNKKIESMVKFSPVKQSRR